MFSLFDLEERETETEIWRGKKSTWMESLQFQTKVIHFYSDTM